MNALPFVIGISAPAEGGKDTAAELIIKQLIDSLGLSIRNTYTYSMATPIKEMCKYLFEMTDMDCNTKEGKRLMSRYGYGKTHREILQEVGTELFRKHFHDDFWIDVAERQISQMGLTQFVVIPDIRFENEADWVLKNGILIHINPTYEGYTPIEQSSHASEQGYPQEPDLIIDNDSTVREFRQKILEQVVPQLLKILEERSAKLKVASRESVVESLGRDSNEGSSSSGNTDQ